MDKVERKLSRRTARAKIESSEGVKIKANGSYYSVVGETLETIEKKFSDFEILHDDCFWRVATESEDIKDA